MREAITTLYVGTAATIAQAAQTLPADPTSWGQLAEKLGVIGLLCLFIFFLLKERTGMKSEHKAELEKKDAVIRDMQNKMDRMEDELQETREELRNIRTVLLRTTDLTDVGTTVKRSALKLQQKEDEEQDG